MSNNNKAYIVIFLMLKQGILKFIEKGNFCRKSTSFSCLQIQFYNQQVLIKNNIMAKILYSCTWYLEK